MTLRNTLITLSGAIVLGMTGLTGSYAGERGATAQLHDWSDKSGEVVASKMKLPRMVRPTENPSAIAIYHMTVDTTGKIIESSLVTRRGNKRVHKLSEQLLVNLEAFPALPSGYASDRLDFVLVLDYGASEGMNNAAWRAYNAGRTGIHDLADAQGAREIAMVRVGVGRS